MPLSHLSRLGGEKKVMIQRIKEIANYKTNTPKQRRKSAALLLLICTIVYCISPLLTVYAAHDVSYDFQSQNVETMDLSSYFKGIGRRHHPLRCFQSRMGRNYLFF